MVGRIVAMDWGFDNAITFVTSDGRVVGRIVDLERPPMAIDVFCRLHAAEVAARLEAFEQQLQRRRLVREHRYAVALRLRRAWSLVAGGSPFISREVH
jgi:hypothetical protein